MSKNVIEFKNLLETKRKADAVEYLKTHPALADLGTAVGQQCLMHVVTKMDSTALMEEFVRNTAKWPNEPGLIVRCAKRAYAQNMRVLLEHAPSPQGKKYGMALFEAMLHECEGAKSEAYNHRAYDCATQLVQAGALQAEYKDGRTLHEHELFWLPDERHVQYWEKRMAYMMRLGADIKPWWRAAKKSVRAQPRLPAAEKSIAAIMAEAKGTLGACMEEMTPEQLLEKFRALPKLGLPGAQTNHPDSLRGELFTLLSADETAQLVVPEYWARHGGAKEGIHFAAQVNALIPDYLSHLRGRFDATAMLREEPIPHADSVLAAYVRGGLDAGRAQ